MKINVRNIEIKMVESCLTQKELAVKCGIDSTTISHIIRRGSCTPRTAGKLARGLGIPVAEVIAE